MPSPSEIITLIISPLSALIAVWIAYIAILRNSQPLLLVYYQPNPDIPSLIDLVIENVGNGNAINVTFSDPIPINCYGISTPDGEGESLFESGIPMIAPKQRYIFNGGQFAGLKSKLNAGLTIKAKYKYRSPTGMLRKDSESFTLIIDHLSGMPTRTSSSQAIVDALKGPNTTSIQEIRNELRTIAKHLKIISEQKTSKEDHDI